MNTILTNKKTGEKTEYRDYEIVSRITMPNGRTRIKIICPYCSTSVWAYVWSLGGCGKKCPKCEAIHSRLLGSVRKIKA